MRVEVRRTPLLRSLVTFTNARGHLYSARCSPKVLACEQPLKAHFSGAIAQDGVERKLKSFCVLGVALRGSTALIDHAAYLFSALTSWLWSSTSRDREALYPGLHESLMQYVGYGVPITLLLRCWVNRGTKKGRGCVPRPHS